MIKYIDNFIGYNWNNTERHWSGSDLQDIFENNKLTQPNDWYYNHCSITYKLNEYGHRSKPLHQIDENNYILFAGCSHTEGIGLELQKTYPYVLSNTLNSDYYNLAIGGTGIDVLLYNLIGFRHTIKTLPKILVVQWPEFTRFSIFGNDEISTKSITQNLTDNLANFIVSGDLEGYFKSKQIISKKIIEMIYPCKIVHIGYNNFQPGEVDVEMVELDLARDLVHIGIMSNQKIVDDILKIL